MDATIACALDGAGLYRGSTNVVDRGGVAGAVKTNTRGCGESSAADAGIDDGIGFRRSVEFKLALAEIAKAKFVHRGCADGGRMTDVDLLRACRIGAVKIGAQPDVIC